MLWQKDHNIEDWVIRFTVGDDYRWDSILLPFDIEGTRAHAWALARIDILTENEYRDVLTSLNDLQKEVENGNISVSIEDEDCHTVIEQYLTRKLGETGEKIHTGRSRNDQVLTALRLFLRSYIYTIGKQTCTIANILCDFGEQYNELMIPGYTHYQRAMPSTVGLWAMGYAETLVSDLDNLQHAHFQLNTSPLGSAAGYGVPYLELPREETAKRLGFDRVQTHVPAVQLSRGKLELHVVHALIQVAATMNRLASDFILYNTAEFGFVSLPDEYCTGSSIMPQKQNPDVLELARAVYHRLIAEMQVLLTLPANLPSGYHRDLQLTKEAAMRSVLLVSDLLTAMAHLLPSVRFRSDVLKESCTSDLFATAHALKSVRKGIPFREAYRRTAASISELKSPDVSEELSPYRVDGYPGKCRPDLVREFISQHETRFKHREIGTTGDL